MPRALLLPLGLVLATVACGNSKTFPSLCANQVPPPAACMVGCNPAPGSVNACPSGYFCSADGKCDAQCTLAGGQCGDGYSCTSDGHCVSGDACVGLQCNVTKCADKGMQPTTITGQVFAPNGSLPLFGVNVFVPNSAPGAFQPGAHCTTCADDVPADAVASTVTDETGKFSLPDIPDGDNIPVVFSIGKWRRQIKLAKVTACSSTAIAATDTSLPKSMTDMSANTSSVDMPHIAISTGNADALECLVRRLGIADKEITTDKQSGHIHLFTDSNANVQNNGVGTSSFDAGFGGGSGTFSDSTTLWGTASDAGKLASYDIIILSCEGAQHVETKPKAAMDHLKAYADLGGRVFLSHWHNIWLEGSTSGNNANGMKPDVWPALAMWSNDGSTVNPDVMHPMTDTIDEVHNPKGTAFATWMQNVVTPPDPRDAVPIATTTGKNTCTSIDNNKVEQWVYWQKDATTRMTQNFQFTTPNEKPSDQRCGKVVFSDMHVAGVPVKDGSGNVVPYPTSCGPDRPLLQQEKALAFMFFDIASCVGGLL